MCTKEKFCPCCKRKMTEDRAMATCKFCESVVSTLKTVEDVEKINWVDVAERGWADYEKGTLLLNWQSAINQYRLAGYGDAWIRRNDENEAILEGWLENNDGPSCRVAKYDVTHENLRDMAIENVAKGMGVIVALK